MKVKVEELQKDSNFNRHFYFKAVLKEGVGALRPAYFEFLLPSMLD